MSFSKTLVLCCALVASSAAWSADPATAPDAAAPSPAHTESAATGDALKVSPSAALVADLAQEMAQELSAARLDTVHVVVGAHDTRLERALQEALITALFEKNVTIRYAEDPTTPSVRLVAFATPASEEARENMLQKGFSVVKNVLVADPRIGLVTRPFMRDGKKPSAATIIVTVSLITRAGTPTPFRGWDESELRLAAAVHACSERKSSETASGPSVWPALYSLYVHPAPNIYPCPTPSAQG